MQSARQLLSCLTTDRVARLPASSWAVEQRPRRALSRIGGFRGRSPLSARHLESPARRPRVLAPAPVALSTAPTLLMLATGVNLGNDGADRSNPIGHTRVIYRLGGAAVAAAVGVTRRVPRNRSLGSRTAAPSVHLESAVVSRQAPGLIPMIRSSECSRVSAFGVPRASASRRQHNCDELGLDEAAADCVACEVDSVAHAELGEDVGAVAFDGFDA